MGRKILAVIVGYLVSFVWVFITLSLAWMALGAGFAYAGDTPHASTGWSLLMLVLGFIGAVLAGWVAALVGRSQQPATWLAVLMLVLGLAFAFYNTTIDREAMAMEVLAGRSVSEVTMMEAASISVAPVWYDWGVALIGALGAVLGGRMWAKRSAGA